MTLSGVKSGDIVLCDRMGRVFYAIVVERHERELEVEPIDRRVTYRRVKAREVLGRWRKSRAHNGRVAEPLGPRDDRPGQRREGQRTTRVVDMSGHNQPHARGRGDVRYQSPPLPREEARILVRVLLGHGEDANEEQGWTCAIAGGRRTVTLGPGPTGPIARRHELEARGDVADHLKSLRNRTVADTRGPDSQRPTRRSWALPLP